MSQIEIYRAQRGAEAAAGAAEGVNVVSPFTIEVRFIGGLTQTQRDAFKAAADRWSRVIVGDLPSVKVDGETIDDVVILAQGRRIDGPGRVLGSAGPTFVRPAGPARSALLPAKGSMSFDTADLAQMEQDGTLGDVITHEMGHVLGIGTIWEDKDLIRNPGTINPTFVGPRAMEEYGRLRGGDGPVRVPVENEGGEGTADGHWRDSIFGNELMTGFVGDSGNPLSRVTVASLEDMGYEVDMDAAEEFTLPGLLELAEGGVLAPRAVRASLGVMLPIIPIILPDESLQQ
jgi:hypothetical protein